MLRWLEGGELGITGLSRGWGLGGRTVHGEEAHA